MKRKVPFQPAPDPQGWVVFATEFYYNKAGEVQIITQRRWAENGGVYSNDQVLAIKEVRGNGRTRYMIRDWDFSWNGSKWVVVPDNASATWTAYDGDEPAYDYEMVWNVAAQRFDPTWRTSYDLGLVQRQASDGGGQGGEGGQGSASTTRYFHGDHLGTTRGMSDDPQDGDPTSVSPKLVYTAFGELVSATGPVDTRYGYVGAAGYESFGDFAPAVEFPFIHVGYRWYDPFSGRFLQRDPMGRMGASNVYAYASLIPTMGADPSGLVTLQVGVGGSVIMGPEMSYAGGTLQGDVSYAIGIDSEGISLGVFATGGAGLGYGAYIGGGIVVGVTTAHHVGDLRGFSGEAGIDLPMCSLSGIYAANYWGFQGGFGPSAGLGGRVSGNYTGGFDMFVTWEDLWFFTKEGSPPKIVVG